MEQGGPFRFLKRDEFEELSVTEKIVYIDGATAEWKRRGEEVKSFAQLMAGWPSPSERYKVRSLLADE